MRPMLPSIPESEKKGVVLVISEKAYTPGMTAAQVTGNGGLAIVGEVTPSVEERLAELAKGGQRLVIFQETAVPLDLPSVTLEVFPEVKVERKRVNDPPWMGKRPWWQR